MYSELQKLNKGALPQLPRKLEECTHVIASTGERGNTLDPTSCKSVTGTSLVTQPHITQNTLKYNGTLAKCFLKVISIGSEGLP